MSQRFQDKAERDVLKIRLANLRIHSVSLGMLKHPFRINSPSNCGMLQSRIMHMQSASGSGVPSPSLINSCRHFPWWQRGASTVITPLHDALQIVCFRCLQIESYLTLSLEE